MAEITFGTDGWRSTVDTLFNEENVGVVTQAICNYLYNQGIEGQGCVVGYDTRAHSEPFADVVSAILAENGIRALKMSGYCPTPQTAFAVKEVRAAGAVMLTASHNPPEYNGIKFIPHFAGPATPDITGDIEREIKTIADAGGAAPPAGRRAVPVESLDVSDSYVEQLLSLVDGSVIRQSGVRVLFDSMYGAGQDIFARALSRAGCDVIPLHTGRDPEFGGRLPEPTEANLEEAKRAVPESGADLGVALDGDADRFGAIDASGAYLTPNKALTLLLWYLLTCRPSGGAVARSLATTHMLDTIAGRHGRPVFETPVGFKYIGELMRKKTIILGGEESGGMSVAGHIPEKDGLVAGLLLVEMTARLEKPMTELLGEVYGEYGPCHDERLDMPISLEDKAALMRRLSGSPPRRIGDEAVEKVDLRDGVKVVTGTQTWLLVRPSGTEPLVRVYVEARSKDSFDRARNSAIGLVKGE